MMGETSAADAVARLRTRRVAFGPGSVRPRAILEGRVRVTMFDPDQPRDDRGRWTDTGAGDGDLETHSSERYVAERQIPLEQARAGGVKASGTIGMYRRPDGSWMPERKALHERIVTRFLSRGTPTPPGQTPHATMLGGGSASGKSEVGRAGLVSQPKGAVTIDADEIKKFLPEYREIVEGAKIGERNYGKHDGTVVVHEESSYLAKLVTERAQQARMPIVLDQVGDSSFEKLADKVAKLRADGYSVDANYLSAPVELSLRIAEKRGRETGRWIPEDVIRELHAGVSSVMPRVLAEDLYDSVNIFDTRVKGSPILMASKRAGEDLQIHDDQLYREFLMKARG